MWLDHLKRKGKEVGKSPHSDWCIPFSRDEAVSVLPQWWIIAMDREAAEWSLRDPTSALQLSNFEQALPPPCVPGSLSLIGQLWTPKTLPDLAFVMPATS